MVEVIYPPKIIKVVNPIIFLAGPIQGAPEWQEEAVKILMKYPANLTVANPRRNYLDKAFDYNAQVDWETNYLREAGKRGVILFWLAKEKEVIPGRSYAQTSRLELGEWKVRHERDEVKLVIGIEEGFGNAKYIRRRFSKDCPDVLILDSLSETCQTALRLLEPFKK